MSVSSIIPCCKVQTFLLYKAQAVPVGQDQVQHLELARRTARAFNRRFAKVFPEPEPVLTSTPKIIGLDGEKKMSKSLDNTISLGATDKQIRKKLARAMTDPARVTREDKGDPNKCNVFSLHKFFSTDEELAWVTEGCTSAGIGCVDCKTKLADNMIEHLTPIRERRQHLSENPEEVKEALASGANRAREIAAKTMTAVRKKLGLWQ